MGGAVGAAGSGIEVGRTKMLTCRRPCVKALKRAQTRLQGGVGLVVPMRRSLRMM